MPDMPFLRLFRPLLALGLFVLLASGKCQNQQPAAMVQATPLLAQIAAEAKWVHSYENDANGFKAYRPSSYAFPPARGREAFALTSDGAFTHYPIAPTDGNSEIKGTWAPKGERAISISLENGEAFSLSFHALEGGILLLRKE
jgi:hypothetical protein